MAQKFKMAVIRKIRLTLKAMSSLVSKARYIRQPINCRYGTSDFLLSTDKFNLHSKGFFQIYVLRYLVCLFSFAHKKRTFFFLSVSAVVGSCSMFNIYLIPLRTSNEISTLSTLLSIWSFTNLLAKSLINAKRYN